MFDITEPKLLAPGIGFDCVGAKPPDPWEISMAAQKAAT